jgi:type II secretory ATPase GspE/PulE/Tfp pilus assembly ATPase PilB-like protein
MGRIGLFELYAPETGLSTSMSDDARAKVESGVTSEAEVLRVIGG